MTLLELKERIEKSYEHGATDESEIGSGINHDLLIDLDPEQKKGYARQYSIDLDV